MNFCNLSSAQLPLCSSSELHAISAVLSQIRTGYSHIPVYFPFPPYSRRTPDIFQVVVSNFYPDLEQAVQVAEKELEKVKIEDEVTDVVCDLCGRNMVIKYGPPSLFPFSTI